MSTRLATILVPANEEAAVIARTLAPFRGVSRFHVIVIANGCTDATARVARAALPSATVLETAIPGKTHALNLGRAKAAADLPLICLDADLVVTPQSLDALIAPLLSGAALAACGRMRADTAGASAAVRAYYRAWALNPYFANGKFGGLFALSPMGAARVFPLPQVTADDEYIRRSFAPHETAFVPACAFTAAAPRSLPALFAVRRRSLRGARAVRARLGARHAAGSAGGMLRAAMRRPSRWADMLVFAALGAAVRLALAMERPDSARRWERDLTTREAR